MTQEDQIKGTGDTEFQFVEHFGWPHKISGIGKFS